MGTDGSIPMALDYFRDMQPEGRPAAAGLPGAAGVRAGPLRRRASGEQALRLQDRARRYARTHGLCVFEVGEGIGHQRDAGTRPRAAGLAGGFPPPVGADSHEDQPCKVHQTRLGRVSGWCFDLPAFSECGRSSGLKVPRHAAHRRRGFTAGLRFGERRRRSTDGPAARRGRGQLSGFGVRRPLCGDSRSIWTTGSACSARHVGGNGLGGKVLLRLDGCTADWLSTARVRQPRQLHAGLGRSADAAVVDTLDVWPLSAVALDGALPSARGRKRQSTIWPTLVTRKIDIVDLGTRSNT